MRRVFVPVSGNRPTPFISPHWAHKVIHYCKLVPEPDRTWQRDNWSGSTRLCFLPELCTVADLGWPRNPNRRKSPPSLSSLQKAFCQPPSFSFALSCCVSLSVTAPDGLLFSGCSLTSILQVTSFFFSFLCGFIPSGFFEHCELFPLSTLPPASLVSLMNYLGPVTCSRWTPLLRFFPTDACCLWEPCLAKRVYAHTVAGWVSFAVKYGYGFLWAATLWSSGFGNSVAINT